MDPITHTLIGVGIANAFFRRRIGPEAVPVLAVASNLPDVDALVHITGDPIVILIRRSFGHSLFAFPVWSLLLSLLFKRIYPHLKLRTLLGLMLLGAATHVFFDLVNSFGVVLLWPFSDWRAELGIIFIFDLILTGLLAMPLVLCVIKSMQKRLESLSRMSLICVAAYVIFCAANKILAEHILAAQAAQNMKAPPSLSYVFPEPLGPHRWHGVIHKNDLYHNYLIYSLQNRMEPKGTVQTLENNPLVRQVRNTYLARRLEWLFKAPVWKKDAASETSVYDLRFRSNILDRGHLFEFRFQTKTNGQVERLQNTRWWPTLKIWR